MKFNYILSTYIFTLIFLTSLSSVFAQGDDRTDFYEYLNDGLDLVEVVPDPDRLLTVYLGWQQDPTSTMTIHWITRPGETTEIEYRKDGATSWRRASGSSRSFPYANYRIHTTEITSLESATEYEFRLEGFNTIYRFRTMPETLEENVKFISGGDLSPNRITRMFFEHAAERDPDFIKWGGDFAYADGDPEKVDRWVKLWGMVKENLITDDNRLIPIIVSIGNHEVRGGYNKTMKDAPFFYSFFSFPGNRGYGVLDFSNYLSILSLDSDHTNSVRGSQLLWLDETLEKRSNIPYIIPMYHVPAYPSFRDYGGATSTLVRENWVPLFEKHNIRFAFENHDHTFKRTKPLREGEIDHENGIIYYGDGAWGVEPRPTENKLNRWYIDQVRSINHVFEVNLNYSGARVTAFDRDGRTFFEEFVPVGRPALISPEKRATDQPTSPVFEWEEHPGAYGYEIEIAYEPDFENRTFKTVSTTETSKRVLNLRKDRRYFWRVKALKVNGNHDFSSISFFNTTANPPGKPELKQPVADATDQELYIPLSWEEDYHADFFKVQVANDEDFENIHYSENEIQDTFALVNKLQRNQTYYWRVQGENDAGKSEYSDARTFTTAQNIASLPYPYNLHCRNYEFSDFPLPEEAGTWPESMVLQQTDQSRADARTRMTGDWTLPYNLTDGARFTLSENHGIGFHAAVQTQEDTMAGHPGAAIMAINTVSRENIRLSWDNQTLSEESGDYILRPQYKPNFWGDFKNFRDENGDIVEYRSAAEGDEKHFRNITLPEGAEGREAVFIRWRYFPAEPGNFDKGSSIALNNITINSNLQIYWEGDTEICDHEFFLLSIDTEYGNSYRWQLNERNIRRATRSFYNVSATGDYRVIIDNGKGCRDTSRNISVTVNPEPRIPVIRAEGNLLISSEDEGNKWYREGELIGDQQHLLAEQTGLYQLKVTNEEGCSRKSDPHYVAMPAPTWDPRQISIFPNPNDGNFNLMLDLDADDIVKLRILNIEGRTVHSEAISDIQGMYQKRFELEELSRGIYFLHIEVNGNRSVERFIVSQGAGNILNFPDKKDQPNE